MEPGETCRGCLKQEGNMYSMFEEYDNNITLSSLLNRFLNVNLKQDDGLPTTFCEECMCAVIEFYNFTVVFEESEATLQNALQELKNNELEIKSENILHEKNTFHDEIVEERSTCEKINFKYHRTKLEPESIIVSDKFLIDENGELKWDSKTKINEEFHKDVVDIKTEINEVICDFPSISSNESSQSQNIHSQESEENEEEILVVVGGNEEKITKYECKECSDVFLYPYSFQRHMKRKHDKEDVNADDFCTIIYRPKIKTESTEEPNDSNETLREQVHNQNKPFICEYCGRAFAKKSYLTDHSTAHSEIKQFECKFCKKRFRRRTVLIKHLKIHTHPKGKICEICGQCFTDNSTLVTHRQLKHLKNRYFNCLICGMSFSLKSTLDKHIVRHQRHNTEKSFACSICNMKYYDKSSLKRHFDHKHDNDKKLFSCEICGKTYTSRTNLNKHTMKTHT